MKHLNKIVFLFVLFLSTKAYTQIDVRNDTRKFLVPEVDSLEKFVKLNKIDYALLTYSTSNWISIDYGFYGIIKKGQEYYLIRLINIDYFTKKPILKVNQKKLAELEAKTYLKEIASAEAFKFSKEDYHKLPEYCPIKGDTINYESIKDGGTSHIFEHTKTSKKGIDTYAPSFYLERCYPFNQEYGILKGFVNTYDKLTELVEQTFKDDPIRLR